MFLPFSIIFLIFYFDNKVHSRQDFENLEKLGVSFLGEIPFLDQNEDLEFIDPDKRSIIYESFRMLMSNVKYILNPNKDCNIIISTSSIKGEGKTLISYNLSLAFASLNKKVLLIGADLRNPQIHNYLKIDKNQKGLVNFLVDNTVKWEDFLIKA